MQVAPLPCIIDRSVTCLWGCLFLDMSTWKIRHGHQGVIFSQSSSWVPMEKERGPGMKPASPCFFLPKIRYRRSIFMPMSQPTVGQLPSDRRSRTSLPPLKAGALPGCLGFFYLLFLTTRRCFTNR